MSALVGIWESELAKLGEKVAIKKLLQSKSKSDQEREESVEAEPKKLSMAKKGERRREVPAESTISEATMCLLVERFVPC
ncbi:hypothetical protein EUGRSUZ_G00500 [Eucalyptus grandis]|uniref:Uncharacterized protein n=5 Tax=Eucalyptus TaxID=3932 RepID=A0A059B9W6_EUCGR|nr:hypothetical protein EUGRSUZ_G00503 [Eucalyptus grandis]KAK3420838.1 hypothetical protein EUGRSUZ_G00500 [Eucalyptus grandis]